MDRDYQLLSLLSQLSDDVLVDVHEVAVFTGFAANSIRQHKIRTFPRPLGGSRLLKWRLGDIREWIRTSAATSARWQDQHRPDSRLPGERQDARHLR